MIDLSSLWDIVVLLAIALAVAPFFGEYLGKVYTNRPIFGDVVLAPIERGIYRLLGTSPRKSMPAREYMGAILLVNGAVLAYLFWYFFLQAGLPLDPTRVPNMTWDLAFHSASSFTTNTDFTHFTSNESQISFGALVLGWQLALFVSAATGLGVAAAMIRGFMAKDGTLGNYYVDMVRTMTRVLIPLTVAAALIMVLLGVPETLRATVTAYPITGGTQTIYLGPVASYQAISLIGTNGGGWFSANMADPFANPSAFSDLFAVFLMLLIPLSTPFAFAQIVRRRNEAWPYLGTILIILVVAFNSLPRLPSRVEPGPDGRRRARGADDQRVSGGPGDAVRARRCVPLPGRERLQQRRGEQHDDRGDQPRRPDGPPVRHVTPEHPRARGRASGCSCCTPSSRSSSAELMVGRTPEYLGKKIETVHVKWSALALLVHPATIFLPFVVAVLGGFVALDTSAVGATSHNFTSVLYEFTSESANNGRRALDRGVHAYDPVLQRGRGDRHARLPDVPFYAMLMVGERFSRQPTLPPTSGTLRTASATFTLYLTLFLVVITALIFLPVLALGPLAQIL